MKFTRIYIWLLALVPIVAAAGPPYITDDPEPTDYRHYEIYLFSQAGGGRNGVAGEYGIDFNYGATDNLQLTAVLPVAFERPSGGSSASGLGNIELAAKYRFAHNSEGGGWDAAFFPRLFLPASSDRVGEKHMSLLLPLWFQHDLQKDWSTFGGGGCVIDRGDDAKDFCMAGWALTHQLLPNLQLGAELVHQTADSKGASASTQVGAGVKYDLNDTLHVLAYAGPSLQNIAANDRYTWYASLLLTF